jgi:hypothetical protein
MNIMCTYGKIEILSKVLLKILVVHCNYLNFYKHFLDVKENIRLWYNSKKITMN